MDLLVFNGLPFSPGGIIDDDAWAAVSGDASVRQLKSLDPQGMLNVLVVNPFRSLVDAESVNWTEFARSLHTAMKDLCDRAGTCQIGRVFVGGNPAPAAPEDYINHTRWIDIPTALCGHDLVEFRKRVKTIVELGDLPVVPTIVSSHMAKATEPRALSGVRQFSIQPGRGDGSAYDCERFEPYAPAWTLIKVYADSIDVQKTSLAGYGAKPTAVAGAGAVDVAECLHSQAMLEFADPDVADAVVQLYNTSSLETFEETMKC